MLTWRHGGLILAYSQSSIGMKTLQVSPWKFRTISERSWGTTATVLNAKCYRATEKGGSFIKLIDFENEIASASPFRDGRNPTSHHIPNAYHRSTIHIAVMPVKTGAKQEAQPSAGPRQRPLKSGKTEPTRKEWESRRAPILKLKYRESQLNGKNVVGEEATNLFQVSPVRWFAFKITGGVVGWVWIWLAMPDLTEGANATHNHRPSFSFPSKCKCKMSNGLELTL